MNKHPFAKTKALAAQNLEQNAPGRDFCQFCEAVMESVLFNRAQLSVIAQAMAGIAGMSSDSISDPLQTIRVATREFMRKSHTVDAWRGFGQMLVTLMDAGVSLSGVLASIQLPILNKCGVVRVFDTGREDVAERWNVAIGSDVYAMSDDANMPHGVNMHYGRLGIELDERDLGTEETVIPSQLQVAIKSRLADY